MVRRRDLIIGQTKDVLGDIWTNRRRLGIGAKTPLDLFPLNVPLIIERRGITYESPIEFIEYAGRACLPRKKLGHANLRPRVIAVAQDQPSDQKRFTEAHELAHVLLHGGTYHERNWALVDDDLLHTASKPEETEANFFAANLLMPKKVLTKYFYDCLGGPIDGRRPSEALALWLSAAAKRDLDSAELAGRPPLFRARLISQLWTFQTNYFLPLTRRFGLSPTALGLQLCELGLVL